MINTSCKDCVFAEYSGKTQTGCSLGRLDLFREKGVNVLECYDDSEKEFYVIQNRACSYCRNSEWAKNVPENEWKNKAEKESRIKYQAIIIANNSLDEIEKTCNSIASQDIPPLHYTVIFKNNLKAPKIGRILEKYKTKWRLQQIEDWVDNYRAIDLVLDAVQCPYYAVLDEGSTLKEGTIKILQDKIREELVQFALIKNWGGARYIVPFSLHKLYSGNAMEKYEDKIRKDGFSSKIFDGEF